MPRLYVTDLPDCEMHGGSVMARWEALVSGRLSYVCQACLPAGARMVRRLALLDVCDE